MKDRIRALLLSDTNIDYLPSLITNLIIKTFPIVNDFFPVTTLVIPLWYRRGTGCRG
jgi:hypothetical protein